MNWKHRLKMGPHLRCPAELLLRLIEDRRAAVNRPG
jgi:hypothetical protein